MWSKLSGIVLATLWLACTLAGAATKPKRGAGLRLLPAPEFSPSGGVFTNDVAVRLNAKLGLIRFTLDGSEPTDTSPVFTSAILLTNSALLKARAFASNSPPSATVAQTYTLLDASLREFRSNLPLAIIQTFGRDVPHDGRVPVCVRFVNTQDGRSALTSAADFDGRALLNIRGRASLRYSKRSYTLRSVDDADEPLKVSLLGFPKDWDWILYGPHPDKTLMRDVLAYELSNQIGRYATRTKYVEVFVNETGGKLAERDYVGVYVLEEKIKSAKQRVDIQKLGPDDLTEPSVTGGYIFKKDHSDRGDVGPPSLLGQALGGSSSSNRVGFPTGPGGFPANPAGFLPPYTGGSSGREVITSSRSRSTSRGGVVTNRVGAPFRRETSQPSRQLLWMDDEDELPSNMEAFKTSRLTNHLYYVEPASDELNAVQRAWLSGHLNRFESALYGPDFKDPLKGYAAYIDADSFIDHHLLVEVTKNADGFRFSTFFHKDRGGLIQMGPLWDWNLSFGNCNGKQAWIPEYWLWPQLDDQQYSWFRRLFEDPDFGQKYVDRWGELRRGAFATSNILARITELATLLDEAQARNFRRWPILGRNVNPNYYVGQTYEEEVNWMRQWIETRLAWLDKQFLAAPVLSLSQGHADNDGTLSMTSSTGKIYFTLDGSDPRSAGGAVSAAAVAYTAPIRLKPDLQAVARVQRENRWSSPARVRLPAKAASAR